MQGLNRTASPHLTFGRILQPGGTRILLLPIALAGCRVDIERSPNIGDTGMLPSRGCAGPQVATRDTVPLGWSRTIGEVLEELERPASGNLFPVGGAPVEAQFGVEVMDDGQLRLEFSEGVDGVCRGIVVTNLRLDLDAGAALDVPSVYCFATIRHDTAALCSGDVRLEDVLAPSSPDDVYRGLTILAWGASESDRDEDWRVEIEWSEDLYMTSVGRSPAIQIEPLGRLRVNRE